MNIIVCVDKQNGMAFNGRRQTRDSVVTKDIMQITDGNIICDSKSAKLFDSNVILTQDFENISDEFCFIEFFDPSAFTESIDRIILYRWDSTYPADVVFNIDLAQFKLASSTQFEGSSHKKIIREEWVK